MATVAVKSIVGFVLDRLSHWFIDLRRWSSSVSLLPHVFGVDAAFDRLQLELIHRTISSLFFFAAHTLRRSDVASFLIGGVFAVPDDVVVNTIRSFGEEGPDLVDYALGYLRVQSDASTLLAS